jgi:hypothetical protein
MIAQTTTSNQPGLAIADTIVPISCFSPRNARRSSRCGEAADRLSYLPLSSGKVARVMKLPFEPVGATRYRAGAHRNAAGVPWPMGAQLRRAAVAFR